MKFSRPILEYIHFSSELELFRIPPFEIGDFCYSIDHWLISRQQLVTLEQSDYYVWFAVIIDWCIVSISFVCIHSFISYSITNG